MKRQIDYFLLGILWLLAVTLGASFLFNIRFGFDIFALQHWGYLGQLQASNTPINTWFYIYLVLIAFILIFGLYLIARPRTRNIRLNDAVYGAPGNTQSTLNMVANVPAPAPHPDSPAAEPILANSPIPAPQSPQPPAADNRPPRLILPTSATTSRPPVTPVAPPAPAHNPRPQAFNPVPDDEFPDIENIFKAAGYTIKKPPKVGPVRPALFAIGGEETLWVGAVGISTSMLAESVAKMQKTFKDTLEDVPIKINAFVINPAATSTGDIMAFGSADALREYMAAHPADENADQENFEAYSEYIDTVSEYFNKI